MILSTVIAYLTEIDIGLSHVGGDSSEVLQNCNHILVCTGHDERPVCKLRCTKGAGNM